MASSDSKPAVAGGLARHIPVLVRPALDLLAVELASFETTEDRTGSHGILWDIMGLIGGQTCNLLKLG